MPKSALFISFSVCASCGAFMASFLNNVVAPQSGEDGEDSPLTLKQSAQNMLGLVWRSRALKLLIPLIFYSGAYFFNVFFGCTICN